MVNKLANDIAATVMYKLATLAGDNGYMEKDAAAAVNGISRGLGGVAFGRARANGVFNRNGMAFKTLGYSLPDGSGRIGGAPFLVKGLNKPFLLDAPLKKGLQPVNNMLNPLNNGFSNDNIIDWTF